MNQFLTVDKPAIVAQIFSRHKKTRHGLYLLCNSSVCHSRARLRLTVLNLTAKRRVISPAFRCKIPDRIRYPFGAILFSSAAAISRIVSAVKLATTTEKVLLIPLGLIRDKRTRSATPLARKFS